MHIHTSDTHVISTVLYITKHERGQLPCCQWKTHTGTCPHPLMYLSPPCALSHTVQLHLCLLSIGPNERNRHSFLQKQLWNVLRDFDPCEFINTAFNSNHYIFLTVYDIDFLFSALHTTPFLYVKLYFGVLHKHGAYGLCYEVQYSFG